MLQFLKAQTGKWGEIRAAQRMGIEIIPLGKGFTWMSENIEQDRALAQACWQQCREKIESGLYDVAGLRGDADFMVWWHAPTIEQLQSAYHRLLRTELGQHLEPVWSNAAIHRPSASRTKSRLVR